MKCVWHLCDKEAVGKRKYCSEKCRNKYNVTRFYHKRKQSLVAYKGGKCERCGYDKCLGALTFHHKDPTKKEFGLATNEARKFNLEQQKQEVDKCELLCSNCHLEEHYQESYDKEYLA